MLEIKNLTKIYKARDIEVKALSNINLILPEKGFVVITGKSGSGKSTLLNIIGGLDNFNSGEIIIKNKSTKDFKPSDYDKYRNTYVGFVFQEFYLIDKYTIRKNISLALELQGYKKHEINNKVEDILKMVNLSEVINRKPNEISGGQKQRIAIARSLIKNPDVILCDEPTGNLDSETGKQILHTLKELSKEKLVIMVTHDIEFAHTYGDRIIELKDGEIINDYDILRNNSNKVIYEGNEDLEYVFNIDNKKLTNEMIEFINEKLRNADDDGYLVISDESLVNTFIDDKKVEVVKHEEKNEVTSNEELVLRKTVFLYKNAFKMAFNSLFLKKWHLISMITLFIFSISFMTVAFNFTFFNIGDTSYKYFNNNNINTIPIFKLYDRCYNANYCVKYDTSVTDEDYLKFKENYPSITFYQQIKYNIKFEDLINSDSNLNNIDEYEKEINNIVFLDDRNFKLSYGNYPKSEKEIMITDFVAKRFISYELYDVTSIEDLINEKVTYNNEEFLITGIVSTTYDDTINNIDRYYQNLFYTSIYMYKNTYGKYFDKNIAFNMTSTKYVSEDIINGQLPKNDNEIVMTTSYLKEEFNENIDNNLLGNTYELTFMFKMQSYSASSKTNSYKLVGIIDDSNLSDLNYNLVFSDNVFNYNKEHFAYGFMKMTVATLGNDYVQNRLFIRQLNFEDYRHETDMSHNFQAISYDLKTIKQVFYITGLVFMIFTIILIYTFMSGNIKNKQKDIGTLRALGAKGIDVSKIFITESIIILLFSTIIANITAFFVMIEFSNQYQNLRGFNFQIFSTNIEAILITFALAILMVFISTYIPIKRITLMKPINAIKKE